MNFISIFILVLAIFIWGFLHSLFASLHFKGFMRRAFGVGIDKYYRLIYNIFASVSFLLVLIFAAMIPERIIYIMPFPWVIIMLVVEVLAIISILVALQQTGMLEFIGLRQLMKRQDNKPRKLVTSGLYGYVRHPLYTAGLVIIWLLPLMTARLLVIDLALTVYLVVGAFVEERKLRHKFGQEYIEYASETPMFIPFLKKLRKWAGI